MTRNLITITPPIKHWLSLKVQTPAQTRAFFAAIYSLVLITLAVFAWSELRVRGVPEAFEVAWNLAVSFWAERRIIALVVVAVLFCMFILDTVDWVHDIFIEDMLSEPGLIYPLWVSNAGRWAIFFAVGLLTFFLAPLIPLRFGNGAFSMIQGFGLALLAIIGIVVSSVDRVPVESRIPVLWRCGIRKAYFNSAGQASVPDEMEAMLNRTTIKGVDRSQAMKYAGEAFESLAGLLNIEPSELRFCAGTTDAYSHALDEIEIDRRSSNGSGSQLFLVLASDSEYPEIGRHIEETSANGGWRCEKAKTSDLVWIRNSERLIEAYISAAKLLVSGASASKIDLLCLLHVHHATGEVFPIAEIIATLRNLKLIDHETRILCDGAQAIGNIVVPAELIRQCDYYAFCGHKWLGTRSGLGILWNHPKRQKSRQRLKTGLAVYEDKEEHERSTADINSRILLREMIVRVWNGIGVERAADHRRSLAALFVMRFRETGVRCPNVLGGKNGIVTLKLRQDVYTSLERYLKDSGVYFTGFPEHNAIRFCFHSFHGRRDVRALLRSLRNFPVTEEG